MDIKDGELRCLNFFTLKGVMRQSRYRGAQVLRIANPGALSKFEFKLDKIPHSSVTGGSGYVSDR
jgi:hypothetical protein